MPQQNSSTPTTTNLPVPQSYEQILSDALSAYAAKVGINDFNVGSAVLSFFEVVALVTARASGDIFQILRDFSVDRATGDALQRLAQENGVTPITAAPATGFISAIDTSFQKISTTVYAGLPAPNVGSTVIAVGDASQFTATGAVYIGRGTPNVEGPISYSSAPVQVGSYWTITLNTATTKFHNLGETVILAQGGNRLVPIGSSVTAPAIGANPPIQYSVDQNAIILDGETTTSNIPVTALLPGSDGNVPIGAIKSFTSPPFTGATCTNPLAFTTGLDTQTDDQLRVSIKNALSSIGLGTTFAVETAVLNATSTDPVTGASATITSTDLLEASYGAVLYVDNGQGYEETSLGVGLESIVNSALGGEQFFQLACGGNQSSVAKAFLQSTLGSPFDLKGGDTLAVVIGGITYQHTFQTSDFRSPGAATAYEITASINGDTGIGFEALTAGGGTFVVIRSNNETFNTIQVTTPITEGRDASVQMGFPSGIIDTLRLYKNNIPLSEDGNTATVSTQAQSLWSSTISNGDTLGLSVDGTAEITYTFTNADFIATGLFTTVANTNSLASWVEVFNNKLTGVTAEIVGDQIQLSSNLGASNRASVVIDQTSTLVTKGMFSANVGLSSKGAASDYTLQRNTAQLELAVPLKAGDTLAAGSTQTSAQIMSNIISAGSVTLSSVGYLWLLVDNPGQIIPTGVLPATLLTVSVSGNVVTYTSNVGSAFTNVNVGDYLIVWSPDLVSANRLEGRVHAVTANTLSILVTAAEASAAVPVNNATFSQGFVVIRCTEAPQKFQVPTGTSTLDQIAAALTAQTEQAIFSTSLEEFLVITSNTQDLTGSLMVVTADQQGQFLNFTTGIIQKSTQSLVAFYDSGTADAQMPLFIHSSAAPAGVFADPPNSFVTSFTSAISLAGREPNELVAFLHPYGSLLESSHQAGDSQPYGDFVQETSISGTTIGITEKATVRRIRGDVSSPVWVDRYFLAAPLSFGPLDTAVAIVDNEPSTNSFTIPFYRVATTNTSVISNTNTFNATDTAAGGTPFASSFGSTFDFSNFKVLMQAKNVLQPSPNNTAVLYRSAVWGRSGQYIQLAYVYPSVPNAPIGSTISNGELINININLQSGASISSGITAATGWNITVTSGVPSSGVDQVTFVWNGAGPSPALTLSGGEYVNIGANTGFAPGNTGIYRVSTQSGFAPGTQNFSIAVPHGQGVPQTNVLTTVNGAIVFYSASPTTANQIISYVNSSLSAYLTASLANYMVSNNGTGTIVLSTYEDSGFLSANVQLKDGINWLATSNLGGSPQFTFKQALTLPTAFGYAFNNAEQITFSPTTMEQVSRFISTLAVTGFTTLGNVQLVDRGTRVQLSTQTLGSTGSIQIVGGLANSYQVPVLDAAVRIDNNLMSVSANNVAAAGMQSGQWFRLQATNTQAKETLFGSNTSVNIFSADPQAGQATIQLLNRTLSQRNFGKPRYNPLVQGRTFRIEKQGSLVCLSNDPVLGSSPMFQTNVNFNFTGGETLNAYQVSGTDSMQFVMLTGTANFNGLSINDLVTISGLASGNNGTFLVVGVSDDGTNLQVLNPSGVNQLSSGTFTFTGNASPGDDFVVGANTLVAGTNFTIGGTQQITAQNLAATIGTLSGVTASASGSVVTITATTPSASIAISTTSSNAHASGAALAGIPVTSSNFSATTQVSEGDTIIVGSPFNVLNQGQFRVIRRYNDSVWFENANVFEEEVTLPFNDGGITFDATTSFMINATNHTQFLTWNGTGTEPHLEFAQMGDVITFATTGGDTTPFVSANQGSFMVLRSGIKLQNIVSFVMPAGSQFSPTGTGANFDIYSGGGVTKYRVWYSVVGGSNTAPSSVGVTLIPVTIHGSDSASTVANNTQSAINSVAPADLTATASSGILTVATTAYQSTPNPVNNTMPSPFSFTIVQSGQRTFLECVNPAAVNQSVAIVQPSSLSDNRPQLMFFEYNATVPGDQVDITNNAFGAVNVGDWTVVRVLNRDEAIVSGNMANATNVSLNGIVSSLFVEEGVAYSGYKQVQYVMAQPGTTNLTLIAFNTNAQSDQVNQSAGVQMTSLNKMNFSTLIKNGLDAYRYNTGLVQVANQIIYGDPRDNVTYPGVGAAGAVIFIRGPLVRRIQVSLAIRLATGVPFAQTVQQVQNTVTSLVNSNNLGVPLAISSILAAVQAIPGILAVSISFPNYNVSNDLIVLAPGEKALIIDPTSDVAVTQVGT